MVEEFRAYGETIDNIKMEELNEEERDEEESHQHHGDSTHPTKSVTDFLPYIQWLPPSITRRQFVAMPYNSHQLGPSAITENQNWTLLNSPVLRPLRPAPSPPSALRRSATGISGPAISPHADLHCAHGPPSAPRPALSAPFLPPLVVRTSRVRQPAQRLNAANDVSDMEEDMTSRTRPAP